MYEIRKIADLLKLPHNPRIIKDDAFAKLCQSLRDNPDYFAARPIILSNRTGELVIIAGNQRYEAAKHIGLTEVPTYLLSNLSVEREQEITIRDNVSNGEWDFELLANEWDAELLIDWGVELPVDFGEAALVTTLADEEAIPDAPVVPITQVGQIWQLGKHRLMCGDSSKIADVEKLMNGKKADICFTSPPYTLDNDPMIKSSKDSQGKYGFYTPNQSVLDYKQLLELTVLSNKQTELVCRMIEIDAERDYLWNELQQQIYIEEEGC